MGKDPEIVGEDGKGRRGDGKGSKMCNVHVPTPHDECSLKYCAHIPIKSQIKNIASVSDILL